MAKKRRKAGKPGKGPMSKPLIFRIPSASAPKRTAAPPQKGMKMLSTSDLLSLARRHAGAAAGGIGGLLYDVIAASTPTTADDSAAPLVKLGAAAALDYMAGDLRNAGLGLTGQNAAHSVEVKLLSPAMKRAIAQMAEPSKDKAGG